MNRLALLTMSGCLVILMLLPGCRAAPDKNTLIDAWQLCENLEYAAAMPLVRAFLLQNPRDPVAHYLLGKCYQNSEESQLTLAKGEFDMALNLFDAEGDLSILEGIMTAAEFQATLHCDTALVLLRSVLEAEKAGLPQYASLPALRSALDHAQKGLYFNPKSEFLQELVLSLEFMVRRVEEDRVPSPLPPPPPLPPRDTLLQTITA